MTARPREGLRGILETMCQPSSGGQLSRRAGRVAGLMAKHGHQRAAKPVDLNVAAAAELSGLAVHHYDAHYER